MNHIEAKIENLQRQMLIASDRISKLENFTQPLARPHDENQCCGMQEPDPKSDIKKEIPIEIHEAALLVENWMKENGHERWELFGICSRNFAEDQKKLPGNSPHQKELDVYERQIATHFERIKELKSELNERDGTIGRLSKTIETLRCARKEEYAELRAEIKDNAEEIQILKAQLENEKKDSAAKLAEVRSKHNVDFVALVNERGVSSRQYGECERLRKELSETRKERDAFKFESDNQAEAWRQLGRIIPDVPGLSLCDMVISHISGLQAEISDLKSNNRYQKGFDDGATATIRQVREMAAKLKP